VLNHFLEKLSDFILNKEPHLQSYNNLRKKERPKLSATPEIIIKNKQYPTIFFSFYLLINKKYAFFIDKK